MVVFGLVASILLCLSNIPTRISRLFLYTRRVWICVFAIWPELDHACAIAICRRYRLPATDCFFRAALFRHLRPVECHLADDERSVSSQVRLFD